MHACLRGVDHANPQASQFSALVCLCLGEKIHVHRGSNLHHHFFFSSTFCLSPSSHIFFLSHSLSSFSFSSFSLISLLPLFSLPLSPQFSLSGSSRPTIIQGNASLTHEDPSPQLSYRLHSWNKKGDQTVTMTTRATCMILKLIMMTTRHV